MAQKLSSVGLGSSAKRTSSGRVWAGSRYCSTRLAYSGGVGVWTGRVRLNCTPRGNKASASAAPPGTKSRGLSWRKSQIAAKAPTGSPTHQFQPPLRMSTMPRRAAPRLGQVERWATA
nr:hypothetical protein [Meiothermus ruber]